MPSARDVATMLASAPVMRWNAFRWGCLANSRPPRAVRAADPRVFVPEAKVPSFQRVPRLHGNVAVVKVQSLAEPRRQSLLPDDGHKDQNGVGTARVVVLRYGPQPVVRDRRRRARPWRTTPKLRPSCRMIVASKRPLRWNSTCERSPSMPGESEAARR